MTLYKIKTICKITHSFLDRCDYSIHLYVTLSDASSQILDGVLNATSHEFVSLALADFF